MQELAATFITIWLFCEIVRLYVMMGANDTSSKSLQSKVSSPRSKQTSSNLKKQTTTATNSAVLSRRMAGANWQNAAESLQTKPSTVKKSVNKVKKWTKYVAMDCEMVGIGSGGVDDMLARVSIVNQSGEVLLDKYVKPQHDVVDYRTSVSGIRPKDMENGEDFPKVQNEVINILREKILVGHSINNDLAVLFIKHPKRYIRDTAKYKPLAKLVSNGATPSLKRLCKAILGVDIQTGEHNSVEDARAAMSIYNRFSTDWEKYIKRTHGHHHHHSRSNKSGRGRS